MTTDLRPREPAAPAGPAHAPDRDEIDRITPDFRRIEIGRRFPKARLVPVRTSGYWVLAAEIDARPMILPNSARKNRLLRQLTRLARDLAAEQRVIDARVFDGIVDTPGRGEVVKRDPTVRPARFDVVVLVETTSLETAESLEGDPLLTRIRTVLEGHSDHTYWLRASNVRSMGQVDHSRPGVFLFNFFYAGRTDLNLAAWQYTAGWFSDQTGLNNSTVLLPQRSSEPRFRLINHARWDRLRQILPHLIFNRTFRSYVLRHFSTNGVAAQPGLYRLVS